MLKESTDEDKLKRPPTPDDAVTSAASSMAARFLQENLDKGRPLRIPKLNRILYLDGREEKIDEQQP